MQIKDCEQFPLGSPQREVFGDAVYMNLVPALDKYLHTWWNSKLVWQVLGMYLYKKCALRRNVLVFGTLHVCKEFPHSADSLPIMS
jgi:hypothetical protein